MKPGAGAERQHLLLLPLFLLLGAARAVPDEVGASRPAPMRSETAFVFSDVRTSVLCVGLKDANGTYRIDTVAAVPGDSRSGSASVASSSEGRLHVAWCVNGQVCYSTTRNRVRYGSSESAGKPQWLPLQRISPLICEPAFDCIVAVERENVYVTWRSTGEPAELWQRSGLLRPGWYPTWSPCPLNRSAPPQAPGFSPSIRCDPWLVMKQAAEIPGGRGPGYILVGRTDCDDWGEVIFQDAESRSWHDWLCYPGNRYEAVYGETCPPWPFPPGPQSGSLEPWDIGDIDDDSLTDVLGYVYDGSSGPWHWDLITEESRPGGGWPDTISWFTSVSPSPTAEFPPSYLAGDLNNDGRQRALLCNYYDGYVYVFKNEGNNENRLAARLYGVDGVTFAFGDFDCDSIREFVTAGLSTASLTYVYKRVGNDTYALVWTDTVHIPNGTDIFTGDVDADGQQEFFVRFAWAPTYTAEFYLYMYKAVGVNEYQRTLVDHFSRYVGRDCQARSKCADMDGDGVDDIVWCIGSDIYVYKYVGNGQFERIWQWHNPGGDNVSDAYVNADDVNQNGYNEIVVSGDLAGTPGYPGFATFVYELEAIRVLSPNGGQALAAGDTVTIRWRTFTPPRCDSVSLFFTTDNGRTYRPIANGLPPTESAYAWVVPDVHGDSCRVKAIAFGPGWQYDESDSCFSIWSAGTEESRSVPVSQTKLLGAFPNPFARTVRLTFQIGNQGQSTTGQSLISLCVRDVSGRTVATLADEVMKPGIYHRDWEVAPTVPNGIYFLSFRTGDCHRIMKLLKVK